MYRDEGFSGSWIEKRPSFYTLLQDAAKRRFDAVLVTDFDRPTRPDNLRDLGRIQEVFIEHDIRMGPVRRSRLLDLYERSEADLYEELDDRMDQIRKAKETFERRQLEYQERVTYYRQQKVDPDQVYRVLSQIEEIIRFATPAHRKEVFRSLFCEMTVRRDKTLEVSAMLPTEDVAQRLTVRLSGDEDAGGHQLGAEKGAIVRRTPYLLKLSYLLESSHLTSPRVVARHRV